VGPVLSSRRSARHIERRRGRPRAHAGADVPPGGLKYRGGRARRRGRRAVPRCLTRENNALLTWAVVNEYVTKNVAQGVRHPTAPQREGTPLTPQQVQALLGSFGDEQARTFFLLLILTGVRRSEAQQLRWSDVDQVDMVIRVRKSKTASGVRSIAMVPALADALAEHRNVTAYDGDEERVFCHPERGTVYRAERWKTALEQACARARVELPAGFRPQHDLRVTAITNDARGALPIAVMAKAGHASMQTTTRYVKLAGVVFRDEAEAQAARLLGPTNLLPDSGDVRASGVTVDGLNRPNRPE
jgi:integrase